MSEIFESPARPEPEAVGQEQEMHIVPVSKSPTGDGSSYGYAGDRLASPKHGFVKVGDQDAKTELWGRPMKDHKAAAKKREEDTAKMLYGDPKAVKRLPKERLIEKGRLNESFFDDNEGPNSQITPK